MICREDVNTVEFPVSSPSGDPVTIAFDTWPLSSRFRNTGIYVYARNLLSYFQEMAGQGSTQFRPLVSAAKDNDANQFDLSPGFQPYETSLLRIGRLWRYGGACISAFMSKADLLFCPSGSIFPVSRLVPVVATIHDIIPVVFPTVPRAAALRFEFANCAKYSRAIITDSLNSKRDLVNVFKLPQSKVHVVHLACDESIFNDTPTEPAQRERLFRQLGLSKPYIVHHGRIQSRKNLKRLIEAYYLALSRDRNLDFDLVLIGELGSQHEEIVAAANVSGARGQVIFTGPQKDPQLAMLLKSASLAVIPSLYEGFCLPLLEAMSCRTPTVCSNTSCLPEVSGGVLRYFDPLSVEEMSTCIEQVLEDGSIRATLSSKGKERASCFSWRRCAEETLQILRSAALS